MAHDPDAFASMVTLAIKAAQAPLFERLAVLEARLAALPNSEPALLELRDRVTVVETKAVHLPQSEAPQPVDLTPLLERLAATEAKLETLGDVRDRVTVVETKSAMPQPEAKPVDFGPVLDRVTALELKSAETAPLLASLSELTKDMAGMRERLAVAEVKTGAPGPPGKDGKDGKDGADGLGFDNLEGVYDERGHLSLKFSSGDKVKEIRVPDLVTQGKWKPGLYVKGDVVAWDGNSWTAIEDTAAEPGRPEAESRAWQLSAKKGDKGKNLMPDNPTPQYPVVKVHRAP
jgi:hypothetical protein